MLMNVVRQSAFERSNEVSTGKVNMHIMCRGRSELSEESRDSSCCVATVWFLVKEEQGQGREESRNISELADNYDLCEAQHREKKTYIVITSYIHPGKSWMDSKVKDKEREKLVRKVQNTTKVTFVTITRPVESLYSGFSIRSAVEESTLKDDVSSLGHRSENSTTIFVRTYVFVSYDSSSFEAKGLPTMGDFSGQMGHLNM
ncbi:hypothetical protein V1478_007200 [Vespula squamosa]|uniref:Uncharacterized protein n=1 Tax=Vespula squamosa TaxID=30214 RepID=A0ABD2B2G4_VESSQ